MLAIAAAPIAAGAIGTAWIDGMHPLLCFDADALVFPCTAISQGI